jgi:hypothetical protein
MEKALCNLLFMQLFASFYETTTTEKKSLPIYNLLEAVKKLQTTIDKKRNFYLSHRDINFMNTILYLNRCRKYEKYLGNLGCPGDQFSSN